MPPEERAAARSFLERVRDGLTEAHDMSLELTAALRAARRGGR